jgi:hypothetical protein
VILWIAYMVTIRQIPNYTAFLDAEDGQCETLMLLMSFILLGFSLNGLAQVMSTLFTDAKLATQVGPVLMTLPQTLTLFLAVQNSIPTKH